MFYPISLVCTTHHSNSSRHYRPQDIDHPRDPITAHPTDMKEVERMESTSSALTIFMYLLPASSTLDGFVRSAACIVLASTARLGGMLERRFGFVVVDGMIVLAVIHLPALSLRTETILRIILKRHAGMGGGSTRRTSPWKKVGRSLGGNALLSKY